MYILYAGITYQNTPVKLREKLAFFEADLDSANKSLYQTKSILENVIISTCNRTEIYAVVDQIHTGKYYIKQFLANYFQIAPETIENYLVYKEGHEALDQGFRVISGLDSMVLGETQILGQMKQGFSIAQKSGTTGTIFNHLFNEMIAFAKKMHTVYQINDRSSSLSQAALQVAQGALNKLADKHIFVLGAGEMSQLLIKNTENFSIGAMSVFNRNIAHADALKEFTQLPLNTYELTDFYSQLNQADVVISVVSVTEPLITKKELLPCCQNRTKPLLLIDLGVPRNINPHCQLIDGVELWDIDKLNQLIKQHDTERQAILKEIEQEIELEITSFETWEQQLGIIPIIRNLREQTLKAEAVAMESLVRKIPTLTEHEQKVIQKHMKSIVNQTLRTPIKEIKEIAIEDNATYDIQLIQRLFGLTTHSD